MWNDWIQQLKRANENNENDAIFSETIHQIASLCSTSPSQMIHRFQVNDRLLLIRDGDPTTSLGCRTWASAFLLSNYLIEHAELVCNKTVLDLGCGTGLVGLTASALGAGFVYLADGDENVLKLALNNAESNQLKRVKGLCFDWKQSDFELNEVMDCVLAVDVAYDKESASLPAPIAWHCLKPMGVLLVVLPFRPLHEQEIKLFEESTSGLFALIHMDNSWISSADGCEMNYSFRIYRKS